MLGNHLVNQLNHLYTFSRCNGTKSCGNVITIPDDCTNFMIQCVKCGQYSNIMKNLKAVQVSGKSRGLRTADSRQIHRVRPNNTKRALAKIYIEIRKPIKFRQILQISDMV